MPNTRSATAPTPSGSWSPHASNKASGNEGFGLYLHWPFCISKCPYCDFNSHVAANVDHARWRHALLAELEHFARLTPGRTLTSIFFGGGTPSLMEPGTAAALIEAASLHWQVAADLEITLEANPGTVDAARFADFRSAGITRLSMGVQALNDADLKVLGRRHDLASALRAIEAAGRLFECFSFDLIYARPGQTVTSWRAELQRALQLAGTHLSLYQLTIEPGTAFHPLAERGDLVLPDEEIAAALYETTQEIMAAAGLPAYEISNHAAPGAECRHNLTYWRGGDYVGVGPGAHGRIAGRALRQHRAPDAWLAQVAAQGHATREQIVLTPEERAEELIMVGLRLAEGIDAARFERLCGRDLEGILDRGGLTQMVEDGFVTWDGVTLRATAKGRPLLNSVLRAILA
jgi:oxygen-independent coproporphyrinogen-3 oxidase